MVLSQVFRGTRCHAHQSWRVMFYLLRTIPTWLQFCVRKFSWKQERRRRYCISSLCSQLQSNYSEIKAVDHSPAVAARKKANRYCPGAREKPRTLSKLNSQRIKQRELIRFPNKPAQSLIPVAGVSTVNYFDTVAAFEQHQKQRICIWQICSFSR